MWKIAYDSTGQITGHYPDGYPGNVPEQVISVTDDQYQAVVGKEHEHRIKDGKIVPYSPPPPTLAEVKEAKRQELWSIGDAVLAAIDAKAVSTSDKENAAAHEKGIDDIKAGRQSVYALAIKVAAEQAGRTVQDLIAAHERNAALGMILRSIISGEQNRLTAEMMKKTTADGVAAVIWTMTAEQAIALAQSKLQGVAAIQ